MNEAPDTLDWQQDFIATNLLTLGYNAWAGYLGGGHGAIICSTNSPTVGITGETFKTHSNRFTSSVSPSRISTRGY